jgi:hypothetical protein
MFGGRGGEGGLASGKSVASMDPHFTSQSDILSGCFQRKPHFRTRFLVLISSRHLYSRFAQIKLRIITMASQAADATTAADSSSLEKGSQEKDNTQAVPEYVSKPDELPQLPEGGTKAYLAVVGAFTGMFVSFGWVNCIALFQAEYETNQLKYYTSSEVSWITSMECKKRPYRPPKFDHTNRFDGQFSSCSSCLPSPADSSTNMAPIFLLRSGHSCMFLAS